MGCEAQLAAQLYGLFISIRLEAARPFWRHPSKQTDSRIHFLNGYYLSQMSWNQRLIQRSVLF